VGVYLTPKLRDVINGRPPIRLIEMVYYFYYYYYYYYYYYAIKKWLLTV